MTRNELRIKILGSYSDEEWEMLRKGEAPFFVSDFNRNTLLRLREAIPDPDTGISEAEVSEMSEMLRAFLVKYMSEDPDAHLPVILSCLALAFIFSEPLHAEYQTGWTRQLLNGKEVYCCPAREEGADSLCKFCICRGKTD